jgi:LacI family transcriptional regulator
VHDEILRFKLAAAANGLEHSDSAIAEIAQKCGFKSAQYLHTVFRREFGCTPREYQQVPGNFAGYGHLPLAP